MIAHGHLVLFHDIIFGLRATASESSETQCLLIFNARQITA